MFFEYFHGQYKICYVIGYEDMFLIMQYSYDYSLKHIFRLL